MPHLRRQKLFLSALTLLCLILISGNAQAAVYTVTTTADSGAGSIRSAIEAANATLDDDIINFSIPQNDPNCTANGVCTIRLTTGELAVFSTSSSGKLGISNSSGANNLLLDGNKHRTDINEQWSRIFYVAGGADLTLDGLTLTNGRAFGLTNTSFIGYGGGIFIEGGKLTLLNSSVSGNQTNSNCCTGFGGGIYNAGTLIVSNSILNNNLLANGGGIFNAANATATITNSTLNGNISVNGGGIYNNGSLTVSNSNISNNTAGSNGNGVFNNGTAAITFSTINANNGSGTEGIFNQSNSSMTIENSTVSNHIVRGIQNNGAFTLKNSTIKGNTITMSGGAGIYNNGSFEIENSTISGNSARNNGGGIYNNATINITASTITNNGSSSNPNVQTGGGGIFNNGSATANLFTTIIAGNISGSQSGAPDFYGAVSPSSSYNIIGNNQLTTGITDGVNGNQVGTSTNPINPRLAPLGNYGGATQTHALFSDSRAIDKGKSFGLTTDQPGFTRTVDSPAVINAPGGDGTDIGSFEVQASSPVSLSGVVTYGTSPAGQAKFVSGVLLTANGPFIAVADTNVSGNYFFETNLQKDEQYTVVPSKIDRINGITAFDATLVLRCVAAGNSCDLSANQKIAADSDGDNSVTAFDATQILRFIAAIGQNAATGQVGIWKFVDSSKTYNPLSASQSNQNYMAFLVGEIDGDWEP
ncbi:MAG: hypothetical protein M3209_11170 [Acidobacteriota bacterium]|nr:hypothetical protein [Acidobacteriota bacterium]